MEHVALGGFDVSRLGLGTMGMSAFYWCWTARPGLTCGSFGSSGWVGHRLPT